MLSAGIADAHEVEKRSEDRWWHAEVLRVEGELLDARSPGDDYAAMSCLEQALAVAREQKAKALELRAATSLARLWQVRGREQEALGLLGPVCGWFDESLVAPDLTDARSLLRKEMSGTACS